MNYNNLIERLRTEALNKSEEATSALGLYLAVESLVTELSEERYRHDSLQDYEVAQAQELERVKAERDAAISEFRGFCSKCDCAGKRYLSDGQPDARCVTCIANNKCNWKWRGPQKEA